MSLPPCTLCKTSTWRVGRLIIAASTAHHLIDAQLQCHGRGCAMWCRRQVCTACCAAGSSASSGRPERDVPGRVPGGCGNACRPGPRRQCRCGVRCRRRRMRDPVGSPDGSGIRRRFQRGRCAQLLVFAWRDSRSSDMLYVTVALVSSDRVPAPPVHRAVANLHWCDVPWHQKPSTSRHGDAFNVHVACCAAD